MENEIALDVDGSSFRNLGRAGYGGVLRNSKGEWLTGFSGPIEFAIGFANSLEAELEAIKHGLLFAWEDGYKQISCRSDCTQALTLIREYQPNNDPQPFLMIQQNIQVIKEIEELISRDWMVELSHTFREGNKCADYMAKLGAKGIKYVCMSPPDGLLSLYHNDFKGIPYDRL